MANYSNLKTAIENAVDWNNGDNEITGQNLLDILETIIDSLGAKYKFADVATPSSSITTPDEPLFYLAGAGTYTNFSGLSVTIPRGTLAIFYYDTAWHYTTVRTDSDAFFNVNQHQGTPSTTYTKANARNAVPEALRSKGMIITYLTTNGWIIEQNLSTSGTWNADANWQTIGPVSVSQNTETGHTDINIGNSTTPVASVAEVNQLGQEIDSNIEVYGTIDDGNINPTGLVVEDSSTNRNLYFISCQGLEKVIVSDGDMYGFFTAPPVVGSVTSDGARHLDTLSNTEITLPDGVSYLAVRAATQPTFKLPEDGLKQRTDALEEKTDALDIQVNGEKNGYPGYALLSTIANPTDPYYISEKPASGLVASVNVKVGYPSGRTLQILRVTAPQLGGAITYDVIASYVIQQGHESSVVNIPLNIQLADDEYIGIKGTSQDCWYFGQAQGYRLYRDGGYADNYTAAIQIICVGLEQRVYTLEESRQIFDVENVASDIAMFENIGFCGDSYTAGMIVVSENPTVTAQNTNLCWGKILERTHGINAFIYAKGGASTVDVRPTNPCYLYDNDCLPKLLAESAKNLYVISLGHNDCYISAQGPSVYGKTWTKTEFLAEFSTNYRSVISQIASHAPNAKIILCKQSGPYAKMGWGADINNTIGTIGEDLGLPVLDPQNDKYLSSQIFEDTMVHQHPVFAGYAGMAKAFDRQFSWATVEYFDYFKGYTGL